MSILSGTRLGVYEVLALLGAGGMGEVYRAQDTKLGRSVAIKVLAESVAIDPERIGRLEREAKVLAALNHPNIAGLFGMEQDGGRVFLIMELVEGETLADHIAAAHVHGGFGTADLLRIAIQIAEAVESAHERGIVHRDLKPANIKIAPDGRVKVLDFGLARAMAAESAAPAARSLTHSPTLSIMATQAGMILGTAAYMSPEQAKGMQADHRSDVFSFGVVLYEMVTGRQPFQGDTVPDILASVLARDPDLAALPASTHPRLRELIARCLEKNPRRRWQAIGDARAELEIIAAAPPSSAAVDAAPRSWFSGAVVAGTAAVVGVAAVLGTIALRPVPVPEVTRFAIVLPDNQPISGPSRNMLALSPDGRRLAYTADRRIWVRSLSDFEARPIAGGRADASGQMMQPVFSPDGQSLAYAALSESRIKRVTLSGGDPTTICSADVPLGLSWQGDYLYFAALGSQRPDGKAGIFRVPAAGGTPELIVPVKGNERFYGPSLLPDGDHLLFTVGEEGVSSPWENARVVVESIKTHDRRVVVENGADAHYVSTGHLVYYLHGVLFAARFDTRTLSLIGGPTSVIEGVSRSSSSVTPAAHAAISSTGTIIYYPGPAASDAELSTLGIFDTIGRGQPLNLPPRAYRTPRVSPDGKSVVYETEDAKEGVIWVFDLAGGAAPRRLTFEGQGVNRYPMWSSDGRRVAFQSDRQGDRGIFWQPADGSGPAQRITTADKNEEHIPASWRPDGSGFLYDSVKASSVTLMMYTLNDRKSEPFGDVDSPVTTLTGAMFSPDGRWVAYATRRGRSNSVVYVQPFPATGARFQVSKDSEDGHHPAWFRDGSGIAYTPGPGARMSVVRVNSKGGSFLVSDADPIARPFLNLAPGAVRPWDLAADSQHVVGILDRPSIVNGQIGSDIRVVLNWFQELKQRVPPQ